MLASFLLALSSLMPTCPPATDWIGGMYKDPPARAAARKAHRDRFYTAMHSLGADHEARQVGLVVTFGESKYDGCAIHHLGKNEYGLGMGGHLTMHLRDKYGDAPEHFMHTPEVVALMIVRTMRRNRRSWLHFHRGHAGARPAWAVQRFCDRLHARGVKCGDPVSKVGKRLGRKPGHPAQAAWLWERLAKK